MLHDPAFWVAVGFILFAVLVGPKLVKVITAALDERSAKIAAELERAVKLREEAQNLLAQFQRKHRDAMKEADEIITHAKDEAERLAKQAQIDLEATVKRREQLAVQNIAQAEAQAMQEVRTLAVDVAIAATAKLLTEKLDGARADALIDNAIKELPSKLN
jgi:F-type H+-transporting ATPase subunit b